MAIALAEIPIFDAQTILLGALCLPLSNRLNPKKILKNRYPPPVAPSKKSWKRCRSVWGMRLWMMTIRR